MFNRGYLMLRNKVIGLLSTTALIISITIEPISSGDLTPSRSPSNSSGSSTPRTPRSPLSTQYQNQKGTLRARELAQAYSQLKELAQGGDVEAQKALHEQNQEQAITKYNEAVKEESLKLSLGSPTLSKSESKVLKIAREKAGHTEEGLEKLVKLLKAGGQWGEEKQDARTETAFTGIDIITSKLDTMSPHDDSIMFTPEQLNQIRQAAGLDPIKSHEEKILVSKKDAKSLIEKLARTIAMSHMSSGKKSNVSSKGKSMISIRTNKPSENIIEEEPVSIGQKLSLFIRNFPFLGESAEDDHLRDTALEDIMTLIVLEPEGKQPIYYKLRFALEDFKLSPNYSPRLNKYAQYYEDQINGGQFSNLNEGWLKEKEKIEKNKTLELAGLCWNFVMDQVASYADVHKVYGSHDTPLLAIIARQPGKVFQLLDIKKFQSLQELIKFTPYVVIGGVYSGLIRSGIKVRELSEGTTGQVVNAANIFLNALEQALSTGEQKAKFDFQKHYDINLQKIKSTSTGLSESQIHAQAEIETMKEKIQAAANAWDHGVQKPPKEFANISFMITSSLAERFTEIPVTKLGKYSSKGGKKEEEEMKKTLAFKLNQSAKAGYFGSPDDLRKAEEKQKEIDEKFAREKNEQLERERASMKKDSGDKENIKNRLMGVTRSVGDEEKAAEINRKRRELIEANMKERERTDHILELVTAHLKKEINDLGINQIDKSFVNSDKNRAVYFKKLFDETKGKTDPEITDYIGRNKKKILGSIEIKIPEAGEEAHTGGTATGLTPSESKKGTSTTPEVKKSDAAIDQEEPDMKEKIKHILPKVNAATGNHFTLESLTKTQVIQIKNQVLKLPNIETMSDDDLKNIITAETKKVSGPKKFANLHGPLNK